jgi:hypothetical protein
LRVLELKGLQCMIPMSMSSSFCALRTFLRSSLTERTSSGALLTSSISSDPPASTIHLRKLAILNRPGLV